MTYNLVRATDEWMTRDQFVLPRLKAHHPSEASVRWTDSYGIERCSGTCLRQLYYTLTGLGVKGKTTPYTQWIFALGKAVEEILVRQWVQMGIWVANNVKFHDPVRNISGEVDVILKEPDGTLYAVEAKSFYGYNATKEICGNKTTVGRPKTSQLLQTLIYVDLCQELDILQYAKMVYYARDSAARKEFDVTIKKDNKGNKRPVVDGVMDYRFTIDDIYKRYELIDHYLQSKTLPPRDYEAIYDEEKVEKLYELGEISDTNYSKWKKKPSINPIGHWMCNSLYCPYRDLCDKE